MKKHYLIALLLFPVFILSLTHLAAQVRPVYGFTMGASIPVGGQPKDSQVTQFNKYAGIGASLAFKYVNLWDGVITPKDALGFFGEISLIWNPFKKSMLKELNDGENAGAFLSTMITAGPTYIYYFGKSEDIGLFAELGVLFGNTTQFKNSSRFGLGIGGTAGVGIYYSTWLSFGFHYSFLGRYKAKDSSIEAFQDKYVMPNILQLKVGFHF